MAVNASNEQSDPEEGNDSKKAGICISFVTSLLRIYVRTTHGVW